jgi:hypothetical protein
MMVECGGIGVFIWMVVDVGAVVENGVYEKWWN